MSTERARPLVASILTGLLTFAVVVVMFELTVRIDDLVRFGTPLMSPIAVEDELLIRDVLGAHGRPNARFQKWVLNNLGMRGPNVGIDKPTHVLRVVTAGASETFGLYETPQREYPRQLEDSLRSGLNATHCSTDSVEVLNAAIFGMTLPTIDADLRSRVAPLRPDVVVLYPTPVQYLADDVPRAALPDSSGGDMHGGWSARLRPRSTYRLREQLKAILPEWAKNWLRGRDIAAAVGGKGPGWRFDSIPPDRLAQYEADLRHAVGTIRGIGAVPVLMTHADLFMSHDSGGAVQLTAWDRFYPRASGATLISFDSAGADATRRVARDSGVYLFDLAAVVHRTPPSDVVPLFGDYAHFTDRGSALVAGALRPLVMAAARLPLDCRGIGSMVAELTGDHPWR